MSKKANIKSREPNGDRNLKETEGEMKREEDRYRGCLIGLAVGDALGTALEFKRPGTFKLINRMRKNPNPPSLS
jgi:hypothetical protein